VLMKIICAVILHCVSYTFCCADDSDEHSSILQCRQLRAAVDRREPELTCSVVIYGLHCDSNDDNNSLSSTKNEDDYRISTSISKLNLHETSVGTTDDRGNVSTDQSSFLLYVQQQSNKYCIRSPDHDSNSLNYSNYDVFDSELNDLLTCPFGFTCKSNQFVDSSSPILFKDI